MSVSVSCLSWRNLSVDVPRGSERVPLLQNVSGTLQPGEMMALMGPSGSGKTTLLNLLAQRGAPPKAHVSGEVFTDSFVVTPENIRLFSSYVEQEDSLIGSLTVGETVEYARRLQEARQKSWGDLGLCGKKRVPANSKNSQDLEENDFDRSKDTNASIEMSQIKAGEESLNSVQPERLSRAHEQSTVSADTEELSAKSSGSSREAGQLEESGVTSQQADYPEESTSQRPDTLSSSVSSILALLGLSAQKDVLVGTPLRKGISGGQKRRLSVAAQIIGRPAVLFLDEPTSGLDSTAAQQVVASLRATAKALGMIVLLSIHQPSSATFQLFDKVLFLSAGRTVYEGPVSEVPRYFAEAGFPIPEQYNPAEYVLELTNTDFASSGVPVGAGAALAELWEAKSKIGGVEHLIKERGNNEESKGESGAALETAETDRQVGSHRKAGVCDPNSPVPTSSHPLGSSAFSSPISAVCSAALASVLSTSVLTSRLFLKARRDALAYLVRLVMYMCLAILMGTVWLRLGQSQTDIQPLINALFFSGAFMSFMSVAYIPAYLEDLHAYRKEHLNGLYGPGSFILSNFIVGVPFLFGISLLFAIVTYFMCGFRLNAQAFWYYVMWLFLDLVAAESMTIFVSTVLPVFVVALAFTAFANGLWMATGGFLVSTQVLNVFWYYTFYWVNYQRYVFQGMMFNEFKADNVFSCGQGCHCMYQSELEPQCQIAGTAVLKELGYGKQETGMWAGIVIALVVAYRLGAYAALRWRG